MDKALIKQHLNTINFVMLHLEFEMDHLKESDKEYIDYLKQQICDLDTMRQEYQKELDK